MDWQSLTGLTRTTSTKYRISRMSYVNVAPANWISGFLKQLSGKLKEKKIIFFFYSLKPVSVNSNEVFSMWSPLCFPHAWNVVYKGLTWLALSYAYKASQPEIFPDSMASTAWLLLRGNRDHGEYHKKGTFAQGESTTTKCVGISQPHIR